MKGDVKAAILRLADGTRTVKEIAHEMGSAGHPSYIYQVIRQCGLEADVLSEYGVDGIRAAYARQRKALKAIVALDPRSPQGKLAAMGLEKSK